MKRLAVLLTLLAALAAATNSRADPVTKQNGSYPVIAAFTSICAVPGYADYGFCGGDATRFTDVGGKMNAVQPKPGRYNLGFEFSHLTPGTEYRLWATRDGISFSEVGRAVADEFGLARYSMQTDSPGGLGFDLNTVLGDVTIVTTWWSGQHLAVKADGTLSVG